jgi:outer membrane protein assembly factor BamB
MDNNFYAIDASRGNLIWSYACQGSIQTTPLIYGHNVFFACDDGHLYSLNQTTGRLIWRFSPGYNLKEDVYTYLTTPLLSSPVSHNGTIYLGTRGSLFALDAQTWEKEEEDKGDDILNILAISDISPFMIAVIIIIGCLVLIPSIYTYRKNKKWP